jgi:hypothetical protein
LVFCSQPLTTSTYHRQTAIPSFTIHTNYTELQHLDWPRAPERLTRRRPHHDKPNNEGQGIMVKALTSQHKVWACCCAISGLLLQQANAWTIAQVPSCSWGPVGRIDRVAIASPIRRAEVCVLARTFRYNRRSMDRLSPRQMCLIQTKGLRGVGNETRLLL